MNWDGYFAESDYDDKGNWRAGPPVKIDRARACDIIDHGHPRYRDGERAAQVLLDLGVLDAGQVRQLLANVELTAALAFHSGAEDKFLKATGMRVALTEYLLELGC